MLKVNHRIQIPLTELQFSFARSGGPGGQNVNKVNTKATLHWRVTETPSLPPAVRERFLERYQRRISKEGDLVLTSQRFRDQGRNVADCLAKLRDLIAEVATAPKPRMKTKPTKSSIRRQKKAKQHNARKKQLRRPPSADD